MMEVASIAIYGFLTKPSIWTEIIIAHQRKGKAMDDLISREQAIVALRDYLVGKRCPDDGTLTCRLIENEVINKLPTIQPKRGRWIKNETTWTGYKCSVCGDVPYMHTCMGKPMYSYCPYCGSYNGGKNEI